MSPEQLENSEPTALAGLIVSLGGFLALLAAEFSTLHSAGVAFGLAGSQVLLTRPAVYSPKSIDELRSGAFPDAKLPELLRSGTGFAHPHEPALTIGVLVLLGGFLLQLFSGENLTPALLSAGGIAGVQTLATRARVYSPVSARRELLLHTPAEPPARTPAETPQRARRWSRIKRFTL